MSAVLWWKFRTTTVNTTDDATMNMMQLKYVPEKLTSVSITSTSIISVNGNTNTMHAECTIT